MRFFAILRRNGKVKATLCGFDRPGNQTTDLLYLQLALNNKANRPVMLNNDFRDGNLPYLKSRVCPEDSLQLKQLLFYSASILYCENTYAKSHLQGRLRELKHCFIAYCNHSCMLGVTSEKCRGAGSDLDNRRPVFNHP